MAVVTCDDLKRELQSFADTSLRLCLDEFLKQLLEELADNNATRGTQSIKPGYESASSKKSTKSNLGEPYDLILSNRKTRMLAIDDKQTYGGECYSENAKAKSDLRALRCTKRSEAAALSVVSKRSGSMKPIRSDSYNVDLDEDDEVEALLAKDQQDQPLLDGTPEVRPEKAWGITDVVHSPMFESLVGVTVVLNALLIGIETDLQTQGKAEQLRCITGPTFCACFTLELVMRLISEGGREFFCSERWKWNLFDFVMVVMQLMDELQHFFASELDLAHLSVLRMFRFVRLLRITRLLRVIHLFEDLKTIVGSMVQSIGALLWSFVLLLMTIYMFSVLVMQAVISAEARGEAEHQKELTYWFGSLGRTMLTMFECILGGVSWDEVVMPLITDVSPLMGLTFCVYLAVALYAITNIMMGIFVERATSQAREDKDTFLAGRMRDIFFNQRDRSVEAYPDEVTWDQFEEKLEHKTMHEYFRCINVDLTEAKSIFHLLDSDGGGMLDAQELVSGCLRLRGPARALELAMLMGQCNKLQETMDWLVAMQTVKNL